MKLYDLIAEQSGEYRNLEVEGIACDSRRVKGGDVFVCIAGPVADGHTYALIAEHAGASLIVAEHDVGAKHQLIVKDTKTLWAKMCAKWFGDPQTKLRLFGITGTNGKTSISYLFKKIMEQAGHHVGLIGTIQNMIGETVLPTQNTTPGVYDLYELLDKMVKSGCDTCVMEVSSHALDQNRVAGLMFEIGMFTNLTQDHLDYHLTMENYLKAKEKLFAQSKTAVLNMDDAYYPQIASDIDNTIVTYSTRNDGATYTAKNVVYGADYTNFEFVGYETIHRVHMKIGGSFTASNAMCALSAAVTAGVPLETAIEAVNTIETVSGRCESVPTGRDFSVIIDYAHTPDGLENILKTFRACEKNRLVVLFGCGGDRDRTKRPLMGKVAAELADFVIVTSDNPRTESPRAIIEEILTGMQDTKTPYEVIENRKEAIFRAIQNARKGDIIVLAGKGHETYQILPEGKIHFDEREVVAEALALKQ